MDDAPAPDVPKSAKEKLAELVAQRKRAQAARPGFKGDRASMQADEARSAAKSRPALRK